MAVVYDALNYPYIRVRSADWLKRTLIMFPSVARMTPYLEPQTDDPAIAAFALYDGPGGPLLRRANLKNEHVYRAQFDLINELKNHVDAGARSFHKRFGRSAIGRQPPGPIDSLKVWDRRMAPGATFQIHRHKMTQELLHFLRKHRLAWEPDAGSEDGPDYLEMHPALGEAIMATLAVACAENEGLHVVTEFPSLHGRLLGTPRSEILDACIDGVKPSGLTSGQQVFEFLVYRRCDVEKLSLESIVALSDERQVLAEFRTCLEELAETLPPVIHDEERLQQRLNDVLADMFRMWENDQANFSAAAKRFFGAGVLAEPTKFLQKLTEAAIKPETALGAGAVGAAAATAGGSIGTILTAAGAGFAIGLVSHGMEGWIQAREAAEHSPLRYLTSLQNEGVGFSVGR